LKKKCQTVASRKFELDILDLVQAGTLLLLDRGFYHFRFWQQLIDKEVYLVTRLKKGAVFKVQKIFTKLS
jgi:hypothetical protein